MFWERKIRLKFFIPFLLIRYIGSAQEPMWRLATGTEGLRVEAMDVFAGDPDSIYALSDNGLLLSTNNGESWDSITGDNNHVIARIRNALKVDPENSKILYAAHPDVLLGGNDVSKSTDGGRTWERITQGDAIYPQAVIEFDPQNHNTIYVAPAQFNKQGDLLRTTDGGISWTYLENLPPIYLSSVAIDPIDPARLYSSYSNAFYGSVDYGQTWDSIDIGFSFSARTRLAVHPISSAVYATVATQGASVGGIFRSTDFGESWEDMNTGLGTLNRSIYDIEINKKKTGEMFLCVGTPTPTPDDLIFFRRYRPHMDPFRQWTPEAWINLLCSY